MKRDGPCNDPLAVANDAGGSDAGEMRCADISVRRRRRLKPTAQHPISGQISRRGGAVFSASSMGGTCGKGVSTPDDWLLGLTSPALTSNHSRWTLEQTEVSSKQWKCRFLLENIVNGDPSFEGGKTGVKEDFGLDKQTLFIPTSKEARRHGGKGESMEGKKL